MKKNTLIFGGITFFVFTIFLLLLFALLGRQNTTSQTGTQIDENRAPVKAQIENTQSSRKYIPTAGPSPTESPIDLDYSKRIDDDKEIDESQLKNSPDVYLYNKLPYEGSRFSMIGDFVEGGNGAIKFTVTAKGDPLEAGQAAITWMESINLERAVIDTFDITYP